jgi:antitoxin component YwqK of YwqJK toxin-antitoxin module
MKRILTKYGTLEGVISADYYPEGSLYECTLNRPNKLATPYGVLIPQYSDDGVRRKYTKSLSFYPNGDLKSISLHEQTPVATPAGILPAELLTFYEGERIRRIFPLNGKLSGFWSEASEYALARELEFKLPVGEFKRKIIAIHFYENGSVKSMTFWPKDSFIIQSPLGDVKIRIGFSLYPDGSLQSLEPFSLLPVNTPIGKIMAYDIDANGMLGDSNSLRFTPDGQVQALVTSTDRITITGPNGYQVVHEPGLKPSLFNDEAMDTVPLYIAFAGGTVGFHNGIAKEYPLKEFDFSVQSFSLKIKNSCSGCLGWEH